MIRPCNSGSSYLLDRMLFSRNQLISILFSVLVEYDSLVYLFSDLFLVHRSFLSARAAKATAGAGRDFQLCDSSRHTRLAVTLGGCTFSQSYFKVLTNKAWDITFPLFQVTLLHRMNLQLHSPLTFAEKAADTIFQCQRYHLPSLQHGAFKLVLCQSS